MKAFSDYGENFFDYYIFSWPEFCTSIFAESKIWWWSSTQPSRHRSRLSGTKISIALNIHTIGRDPLENITDVYFELSSSDFLSFFIICSKIIIYLKSNKIGYHDAGIIDIGGFLNNFQDGNYGRQFHF